MIDREQLYRQAVAGTFNVDLGNQGDFTAYSTTFITEKFDDAPEVAGIKRIARDTRYYYWLDMLERIPLGMSYPEIIRDVKNRMQASLLKNYRLVVDGTGVGLAILQMMYEEGLDPLGICITGGNSVGVWRDPKGKKIGYTVPKRDIIMNMQAIFTGRRISILPTAKDAKTFITELANYKLKISQNGTDTYEAWRDKIHDDLVMSTGIGLWHLSYEYGLKRRVIEENLAFMTEKQDEDYKPFENF